MFTIRRKQPKSVAGRAWSLARGTVNLAALALIGLKLAGLVRWSWWRVLAPLWVSGSLLALIVLSLLGLLAWRSRRTHVTRLEWTEPPSAPGR